MFLYFKTHCKATSRDSTGVKALALQIVDPNWISGIAYGPQAPPVVAPKQEAEHYQLWPNCHIFKMHPYIYYGVIGIVQEWRYLFALQIADPVWYQASNMFFQELLEMNHEHRSRNNTLILQGMTPNPTKPHKMDSIGICSIGKRTTRSMDENRKHR